MRWDVVGFILGWTIRLVALPLALVAASSCYLEAEGYDFAIRAYLIPLILAAVVGQSLVSLARGADIASRLRDREAFARRSRMDSRGFARRTPILVGRGILWPCRALHGFSCCD